MVLFRPTSSHLIPLWLCICHGGKTQRATCLNRHWPTGDGRLHFDLQPVAFTVTSSWVFRVVWVQRYSPKHFSTKCEHGSVPHDLLADVILESRIASWGNSMLFPDVTVIYEFLGPCHLEPVLTQQELGEKAPRKACSTTAVLIVTVWLMVSAMYAHEPKKRSPRDSHLPSQLDWLK